MLLYGVGLCCVVLGPNFCTTRLPTSLYNTVLRYTTTTHDTYHSGNPATSACTASGKGGETGFNKLTINNLTSDQALWVPTIAMVFLTLHALRLMRHEYR